MNIKRIQGNISNFIGIAALLICTNAYAQAQQYGTLYIKAKGLSIAYHRYGKGPAIVLIHGFTQDSRVWKPQLESLSKHFTVITWDVPGAGISSDPTDGFTFDDWADCLARLLDSTHIKRAQILGISWGGVLAEAFYQRHPGYVTSLILSGTNAGWKGTVGDSIANVRLSACLADASLSPQQLVSKYLPTMFSDSASMQVKDELSGIMLDTHPVGFRLMAKAIANADMRDVLSNIKVPTLLLWGDADKRSPLKIANKLKEEIPGSQLVIIPKAGHMSNMENPEQFNKMIIDFCLEHSGK